MHFFFVVDNNLLLQPSQLTQENLLAHYSLLVHLQDLGNEDIQIDLHTSPSPPNNDFQGTLNIDGDNNDYVTNSGYTEDLSSFDNESNSSTLFSALPLDQPSTTTASPTSHILNFTEIQLMELKSSCVLSTKTMNKIIGFCKTSDLTMLPKCYEDVEGKLFYTSIVHEKIVEGITMHFIPLQNWLPLLLQVNLLISLVVSPTYTLMVGDLSSSSWFSEFLGQADPDCIPLAID